MRFGSDGTEGIRNLASVGILLGRFVDDGTLRILPARTITGSAETCSMRIKALAEEHEARCLVIDPVSTLSNAGNEATAHGVCERKRSMSIIKSRRTAHSSQVRDLIFSDAGVTLVDIFTAVGEALMGTMRWEEESVERVADATSPGPT